MQSAILIVPIETISKHSDLVPSISKAPIAVSIWGIVLNGFECYSA